MTTSQVQQNLGRMEAQSGQIQQPELFTIAQSRQPLQGPLTTAALSIQTKQYQ